MFVTVAEAKKNCYASPTRWRYLLAVLVLLVLGHVVWFLVAHEDPFDNNDDDVDTLADSAGSLPHRHAEFRCGRDDCFRGVKPALRALYVNMTLANPLQFDCLDGKLRIPWSSFNDDYCDCADGSDEPGTPACSQLRRPPFFYCAGSDAAFATVFVDDGVCDCCDGSDETSADCVDTCGLPPVEAVPPPREELQHPTMRPPKRLVNPVSLPLKIVISMLLSLHLCVAFWILSVVLRSRNPPAVAPVRKVHL